MAATATLRIDGTISSEPSGTDVIGPLYITSAAACYQKQVFTPANGANTITCPTGTGVPTPTAMIIIPASNNAVGMTLKGVSGDTGIALSKTLPTVIAFDTMPATFVITAASGFATALTILFI